MNIEDFVKSGAPVSVTVGAQDLHDFARSIATQTRQEIEREITESKSEAYYTSEQVGKLLSVDKTTLWRWSKRGYLVPIKVGGLLRYRKSHVDRILNFGK